MQLYYFLAIIISLSLGSLPGSERPLAQAACFSAVVIAAWWCLCLLAVRLVSESIRDGDLSVDVGFRWFDRQMELFRWLSLALIGLCLGGFGLGHAITTLPIIDQSMTLQAAGLLIPTILVMTALWVAEYLFGVRVQVFTFCWRGVFGYVTSLARSTIGWVLIPIFMVMFAIDLSKHISLPAVPAWIAIPLIGLLALLGLPALVRRVFPSSPPDEDTERFVRDLLRQTGYGKSRIAIWNTGGRTYNAMVAGFFGRFRIFLLSDRLVSGLTRDELGMVILHEVAHIRRRHIPLRIVSLVPAWMLGFAVERFVSESTMAGVPDWAGTLGSAATILAAVVILRVVSYRIEYDADRVACDLAGQTDLGTTLNLDRRTAVAALSSALLRVTDDTEASRRSSWLHPSIADRVQRLRAYGISTDQSKSVISSPADLVINDA